MVLDEHKPLDCVQTGYNRDNGILFINDVTELSRQLDIDTVELTAVPTSFRLDDCTWAVPFPSMLAVAKTVALVFSGEVLAKLEEDEAKAETLRHSQR